jgi:hypothetical protein
MIKVHPYKYLREGQGYENGRHDGQNLHDLVHSMTNCWKIYTYPRKPPIYFSVEYCFNDLYAMIISILKVILNLWIYELRIFF